MDKASPVTGCSTPCAAEPSPAAHGFRAISSAPVRCQLNAGMLVVPPFRLPYLRQHYVSAAEIRIDLASIAPGRYRVLVVHNFHVEDRNPSLDECIAAVFLAAWRDDDRWEEPERFPMECRALAVLGELLVRMPSGTRKGA
jgi:hypothetical protein